MKYNKLQFNKKGAFSLAEVLISLLIISVILLLALPVITKKNNFSNTSQKGGSQVFLFQEQSEEDSNFPCYVTTLNSTGTTTIVKNTTGKCQRYTFTVPNDVYKVDLTLVAGGGGGGGAAGGTVFKKEYDTNSPTALKMLHSRIQKFVINLLVSSGANGKERDKNSNSTIFAGQGGASGSAIINHNLPLDFLKLDYTPDFLSETANENSALTMKFGNEHDLFDNMVNKQAKKCIEWDWWDIAHAFCKSYATETLYDVSSYPGYGLMFETEKVLTIEQGSGWDEFFGTSETDTKAKAAVFVPSPQGDGNEIQCFTTSLDEIDGKYIWGSNSSDVMQMATNQVNSEILPTSAIASSLCKLSSVSFIPSNEGKTSFLAPSNITGNITNGYIVQGGEGGRIYGLGNYGAGGRGESAEILCGDNNTFCSLPNNNIDTSNVTAVNTPRIKTIPAETGINNFYGKVTAYIQSPGGSGSGGAGGSAVKINDFPVVPGARYTIVVGSGGAGGSRGMDGTVSSGGFTDKSATEGYNGTGGSSSAIYDEDNNLVLLVIGGVGGYGGTINTSAEEIPDDNDLSDYAPLPDMPKAARNVPMLLSKSADTINKIVSLIDKNVVASIENLAADTPNEIPNGLVARRIVNRFMTYDDDMERISPIYELNSNSSGVPSGGVVTTSGEDDKTGGFSAFDNNISRSLNDITKKPSATYNGLDDSQEVYLGLYFRYLTDNVYSYAGGLGGFSGLGTKAGCGGLFVGNFDGLLRNGLYNNSYRNTFMINTAASGTNYVPYYINNYYDNCTISNSNGQKANFVAPVYIPSAGENLGSAGSGGGGGGYSSKYGAGNGGDGQNGYVMINWHY